MSKAMSAEEIRTQLQTIDPYDFEHFVGELWESQGWETEVSQGSNDMGVDVVATKENGLMDQKAVIQAKRYSDGNKVGRPKIQQYYTLKEQDTDADAAVVVTTSEFTSGAEDWASEHNVKLVDADDLVAIVREEDRYDLVEEYAEPAEDDGGGLLSGLFGGSSTNDKPGDTSPTSSTSTGSVSSATTSTSTESDSLIVEGSDYFSLVAISFVLQIGTIPLVFDPSLIPAISSGWAFGIGAIAWLAQPFVVFADANDLKRSVAVVQPNRVLWPVVVFFVPIIGMILYLKRRISL